MIDVDFSTPEVQKTIGELAKQTGMSLEEILKEYEYAEKHKTYVRFTEGVAKGKVGYYFPSTEIFPYSRNVYCPDGSVVVTMGWDNHYEVISEEEYLKENADD